MIDSFLIKRSKKATDFIAKQFIKLSISAKQVTLFGLISAIICFILIINNQYKVAIIFIIINRFFDAIDGSIARITKTDNKSGAFFDIIADFIFYGSIPLAISISRTDLYFETSLMLYAMFLNGSSFLIFALLTKKSSNKYYKKKGFYYSIGLIEASETTLVFITMLIFTTVLSRLAVLFSLLLFMSFIIRVLLFYKLSKGGEL